MSSSSLSAFARSLPSSEASSDYDDPRLEPTLSAVNWDVLAAIGIKAYHLAPGEPTFHWGEQFDGGYNLARFLHLHNRSDTILVVRVPLLSKEAGDLDYHEAIANKIASEVASMQYVERFTTIPVPHIYCYSPQLDPHVGSPYIVMAKAEGVRLVSVWQTMEESLRRSVLSQVIDILLELWSHRFEKQGCLFRHTDGPATNGKDDWFTQPTSLLQPNKTCVAARAGSRPHRTAAAYWHAYANVRLEETKEEFGQLYASANYLRMWFLRSLIPDLFDPSLDECGYPLAHGDFHSQNIMVTDVESSPRITAIIDWEFTEATYSSGYSLYPFFIVDHPAWDDDDPRCERNVRDQATFNELLFQKEQPGTGIMLSSLVSSWRPIYLFQQAIEFPRIETGIYPALYSYVFGDNGETGEDCYDDKGGYYGALRKGALKGITEQLDHERKVRIEAQQVLGIGAFPVLNHSEFRRLIASNIDKFEGAGLVHDWFCKT